jgi:hypothetical protein
MLKLKDPDDCFDDLAKGVDPAVHASYDVRLQVEAVKDGLSLLRVGDGLVVAFLPLSLLLFYEEDCDDDEKENACTILL